MDVRDLSLYQIEELKVTYLYNVENEYTCTGEIPNEVIYDHFSHICFVNDDFACTVGM